MSGYFYSGSIASHTAQSYAFQFMQDVQFAQQYALRTNQPVIISPTLIDGIKQDWSSQYHIFTRSPNQTVQLIKTNQLQKVQLDWKSMHPQAIIFHPLGYCENQGSMHFQNTTATFKVVILYSGRTRLEKIS